MQDGTSALTVADGALQTVQEILQRMRSLIVEGRSDLLSSADRQNLNAELHALGTEIDTIASKTEFNGRKLLDGSLSASLGTFGTAVVPQNDVLASGEQLVDPSTLIANTGASPLDVKITIDAFDAATNLVTYTVDVKSTDASQTFQTVYPESQDMLSGQNYDNFWNLFGGPIPPNVNLHQVNDGAGNPLMQFSLGHVSGDRRRQVDLRLLGAAPAGQQRQAARHQHRPRRGRHRLGQRARRLAEPARHRRRADRSVTTRSRWAASTASTRRSRRSAAAGPRWAPRSSRWARRPTTPRSRRWRPPPPRARSATSTSPRRLTQYTKLQILTTDADPACCAPSKTSPSTSSSS